MKTCTKCLQRKALKHFYKTAQNKDGYSYKCSDCTKDYFAKYRDKNRGKIRDYESEYFYRNKPKARASMEKYRSTKRGIDATRRATQKYKSRYPEKIKAKSSVQNAIKTGRLKRKRCEKCRKSPAEAHHDDYSKPLHVRWLCKKHHVEHHKKFYGRKRNASNVPKNDHQ